MFYIPVLIGAFAMAVLSVLTSMEVWGSADAAKVAVGHLLLFLGLPAGAFIYTSQIAQGVLAGLAGILAAAAALMLASILSGIASLLIRSRAKRYRLRQSILGDDIDSEHPEAAIFE